MRLSISIVIALLFLCLCVPFSVIFAAEPQDEPCLTIVAPDEKIVPGTKFDVEIGLKNNPGIIALNFNIVYDHDLLELVGYEDTTLLQGFFEPAPTISSPYTFRWSDKFSVENNGANGIVLRVSFILKRNIEKIDENNISVVYNSAIMSDLTYEPNFLRSVKFASGQTTINTDSPVSLIMETSESELVYNQKLQATVSIDKKIGFDRFAFRLDFSSEMLELVEVCNLELFDGFSFEVGEGYCDVSWVPDERGSEKAGEVVRFTFKAKKALNGAEGLISVATVSGYMHEEIPREYEKPIIIDTEYQILGCSAPFSILKTVFGDADGNGIVDEIDSALLAKWLNNWENEIDENLADVDEDNCISDWDAVLLDRYLAGWELTLGALAD